MITRNISKYIQISKFTYLAVIFFLITASFHSLIFISVLLIIHEIGHFLTAKILGVEVDKIYIYPFGGIAKFHIPLNFSITKELLILINGPIFQELAKILLITIFPRYSFLIISYHYSILIFNLLPIYPLDGGKLINLVLSIFKPFKKSLQISLIISYVTIVFLLIINYSNIKINTILMISILIYKVILEQRKTNYKYEMFLLERYINEYKFKKSSIINSDEKFYRSRRHLLNINNEYSLEKDYLARKYLKNR